MSEPLLSVGLDVGTTTTQLVVSRLWIENRASAFSVPDLEIARREILHRSPVWFTPIVEGNLVDGEEIRELVEEEYKNAGIKPEEVDTGAVIVTGETSRRENAAQVMRALSSWAGTFVVATAGPDLEAVLAAQGSGAVEASKRSDMPVLHMDIGGGTANLCLIRDGMVERTGCLNVGGRLVKADENGKITYVSREIQEITKLKVGESLTREAAHLLAAELTRALEMAAGLIPSGPLLAQLQTREAKQPWAPPKERCLIFFSGGVADCIISEKNHLEFGDIGPELGREIRKSRLCQGQHQLGAETIRATVIGAGCHSTQLSGSTVFARNVAFPLKDLPVMAASSPQEILANPGEDCVWALPGEMSLNYGQIRHLAESIASRAEGPVYLCLEADMAKALGQALAARLPESVPILCIDRVRCPAGSYLDVGGFVGPALQVVVKTLVLENGGNV